MVYCHDQRYLRDRSQFREQILRFILLQDANIHGVNDYSQIVLVIRVCEFIVQYRRLVARNVSK
jgi:hypothetical protein